MSRAATPAPKTDAAEFDIARIDEIIHGRIRLGVMAFLAGMEQADFNTLKAKLATTDGTLSVHLRKLEEAGYILVDKGYNGRRPVTRLSLSAKGRKAFQAYLAAMARLADLSEG
jgi:DNA-binding MarR family transcriptional regulator